MNENDESLDALRVAWRSEALGDELPDERLDACDAPTREAVNWLRDAWESQRDASVPPLPIALARAHAHRGRRPVARRLAGVAVAVAAVLLAIASLRRPGPEPAPLDVPVASGEPASEPLTSTYEREAFRSREDGVEIVRGSVRLVLLTDQ